MIRPPKRPLPDNTQHTQETDIHAPGGIRIRNPSKRAAADPRLRPRGQWVRHNFLLFHLYSAQYFLVVRRQSVRLDYGLDVSSSIPGKDKKKNLFPTLALGPTQPPIQPVMKTFPETKWPGRETDRSSPPNADTKNIRTATASIFHTPSRGTWRQNLHSSDTSFLSFFLSQSDLLYLLIVGVEVYCCT